MLSDFNAIPLFRSARLRPLKSLLSALISRYEFSIYSILVMLSSLYCSSYALCPSLSPKPLLCSHQSYPFGSLVPLSTLILTLLRFDTYLMWLLSLVDLRLVAKPEATRGTCPFCLGSRHYPFLGGLVFPRSQFSNPSPRG